MENLIIFIAIGVLLIYTVRVVVQAKRQGTRELFSVSDAIVKVIYESGGTIEKIEQVDGSLELDLAEFEVSYFNAQGILEVRIAYQAFDSQGKAIGHLHWNKPILPVENEPPSDFDKLISSKNLTSET